MEWVVIEEELCEYVHMYLLMYQKRRFLVGEGRKVEVEHPLKIFLMSVSSILRHVMIMMY